MRESSGRGDGTTNLRDPTLKEHEAAKGKSGGAAIGAGGNKDEGKRQSPAGGPPGKH